MNEHRPGCLLMNAESPVTETFKDLLDTFRGKLDGALAEWLATKDRRAASLSPASSELSSVLAEYLARGGKRLRPGLLYYSYRGCGGNRDETAMTMAMAVELLHTYLLIHDDIMDHALVRRGRPAAHVLYGDLHEERGWSGDGRHFGISVGILLGDLAQAYSQELFASVEVAPTARAKFLECYATMCEEVILGQYLEMTAGYRSDLTEDDLLKVLQMKSGRYSVERPIQLGALLAGADADTLAGLSRYGLLVGEAFQLQDDLLGMFGDAKNVGKSVGGDLAEGKFTVLVHHTLQGLAPEDRESFLGMLGDPGLTRSQVDRARAMIEATGARERVAEMVEQRMKRALRGLEEIDLEPEGRVFLEGVVEYLKGRDR